MAGANFCTGFYDMETTTEREMCGLHVFVYNRRYFGSGLDPLFSGLSPVLSMTYIVIRTKFRSRDVESSDADPHIFSRLVEAKQFARRWKQQDQNLRRRSRCVYTVHAVRLVPDYTTTLWYL